LCLLSVLSVFYQGIRNDIFELWPDLSGFGLLVSNSLFLMRHKLSLTAGVGTTRHEEGNSEDGQEYFFHDVEKLVH